MERYRLHYHTTLLPPIQATEGKKSPTKSRSSPLKRAKSPKENKEATPRDSINLSRGVASLARAYLP